MAAYRLIHLLYADFLLLILLLLRRFQLPFLVALLLLYPPVVPGVGCGRNGPTELGRTGA